MRAGSERMPAPPTSLREVAGLFLRLGSTAFGGPAAHIAMMEDEVVRRRGWLTREQFLDYLGATNLIPGPNSTELAIHIGHARAGWRGLVVAGVCFIVPATVIVWTLAWAYVRYGHLPEVSQVFYGLKPVIIAIILHAAWRLGATALKTPLLGGIALASAAAAAFGVHELIILAGGAVGALGVRLLSRQLMAVATIALEGYAVAAQGIAAAGAAPVGLVQLFQIFVKIGSVLFGSGYVLVAFLRADFVERLHWLTEAQLIDAIAVGQITPGPVFTTATFIGYVLAGTPGAAVATVGIFLPAFFFVAVSRPLIPRLRASPVTGAMLDGVNAASLALIAVVSVHLGRTSLVDPLTVGIAVASLIAIAVYRVNASWLIVGSGLAGLLVSQIWRG